MVCSDNGISYFQETGHSYRFESPGQPQRNFFGRAGIGGVSVTNRFNQFLSADAYLSRIASDPILASGDSR